MNHVLRRVNTNFEHSSFGRRRRPRLMHDEPEAASETAPEAVDDGASRLALFIWGALTALALWWLYLRPATTERKLNTLRPNRRPGPRAGSRPASAAPPRNRAPAETAAGVTLEPDAADDLTRILGIGPARAARLREAGIATFAALAMADADQLRAILAGSGVSLPDISSWPEQASRAAKGDWDGLAALQDRLRAERS